MQEPEVEPFVSSLLQNKETIHWRVSNLSQLVETNCWPAMSITTEMRGSLGRNYSWRISLFGDDDYLYGRAELVVPVKYRIPYRMKFTILNKPEGVQFEEEDESKVREITNMSEPQKWRIVDKKFLGYLRNPDDTLDIKVDVFMYGSETSKGFNVQNFPF